MNDWVYYVDVSENLRLWLFGVYDVIFVATIYVYEDLYMFWIKDEVTPWSLHD